MNARTYRTLQALILGGTGLFLLDRIWSGTISFYINMRFQALILLGAVGLLAMAQQVFAQVRKERFASLQGEQQTLPGRRKRLTLLLVSLPLLLGILIPAEPRGVSLTEAHSQPPSVPGAAAATSGPIRLALPAESCMLPGRQMLDAANPAPEHFISTTLHPVYLGTSNPNSPIY